MTEHSDSNKTFTARASYNMWSGPADAQSVEISLSVATIERAREIAGMFPKAAKATAYPVASANGNYAGVRVGSANLVPNGTKGAANETGVARYRKARKAIEALGFDVEWVTPFKNSYATEAEFEAALAGEEV